MIVFTLYLRPRVVIHTFADSIYGNFECQMGRRFIFANIVHNFAKTISVQNGNIKFISQYSRVSGGDPIISPFPVLSLDVFSALPF